MPTHFILRAILLLWPFYSEETEVHRDWGPCATSHSECWSQGGHPGSLAPELLIILDYLWKPHGCLANLASSKSSLHSWYPWAFSASLSLNLDLGVTPDPSQDLLRTEWRLIQLVGWCKWKTVTCQKKGQVDGAPSSKGWGLGAAPRPWLLG